MAVASPFVLSKEQLAIRVDEVIQAKGPGKWGERVVVSDAFAVTIIQQPPGTPNDHHYHLQDEVWWIYKGELTWQYEHHPEAVRVRAGDIVFAPKNLWHHIEPVGTETTIRIACTPTGEFHRYDRPGCKELPKA